MNPRIWMAHLALISALALSGCADQILNSASSDPTPSTTAGEETATETLAQFSTDAGRVPQPSDLVLSSVNAALTSAGQNALTGVSKSMPIRIPFSGALPSLYADNGSWNSTNGLAFASNLLIFPSDNGSALVRPWPTHDKAGNAVTGGTFKAVYQDSNNDLVLVPGSSTFTDNKTYVVAVKKALKDASGNNLGADVLGEILMGPNKIVENGKIVNTLVREKYKGESDGGVATATALEGVRGSYNGQIVAALKLGGAITSYTDLALLYTFKTEEPASAAVLTATNSLLSAMAGNIGNTTTAFQADPVWESATTFGAYAQGIAATPATDNTSVAGADLKATLQAVFTAAGATVPMDNIDKVYKGYVPCLNFLDNSTSATTWALDLASRAASPGSDCPNSVTGMTGKIGVWVAKPATASQVVIYQHGITSNKDTLFAIANTLAGYGMATVAIDIWGHGERAYEDADADGAVENTIGNYADSGQLFMRPDNPSLTVGYMLQTQADLTRLSVLLQANPEIIAALGFTPTSSTIHFVGVSLGGIIGSNLAGGGQFPANKYVLNVPGGDLSDIILNGYFGSIIRGKVAQTYGYDTNTKAGEYALNSTVLGVDLSASHAVFKGGVDPLATGNRTNPTTNVLVQEMTGDTVVPNNNTELLAHVMGLKNLEDGDAQTDNSSNPKVRWTFDPANYTGGTPGHGFLLDGATTATQQGQLQAVCFLYAGKIPNPAATINPSTCSN
jgi:hypothetical protein